MELQVKRLTETATLPTYAHQGDAGMDLYADEAVTVLPGERVQVKTGIAMAIPVGYVGLVWDKGGLSHKKGLKTLGGVMDAGYRGEVLVGVLNASTEPIEFVPGNKVAQMLIQRFEQPILTEVEELSATDRGEAAFGSTGV